MNLNLKGQVFGLEPAKSGKGTVVRLVCAFGEQAEAAKFFVMKDQPLPKVGDNINFTVRVQPSQKGLGVEGFLMALLPSAKAA